MQERQGRQRRGREEGGRAEDGGAAAGRGQGAQEGFSGGGLQVEEARGCT